MEQLINHLLTFNQLSDQQIALIKESAGIVEIQAGAYLSEAGRTVNQLAIVKEGILRVCYYNKDGEEITRYFIDENNLATDLSSFSNQIPSSEYVQAVMPTKLYVFRREILDDLSNTILIWDSLIQKVINKALMEKVNRISPMLGEDAKTRYLEFHKRFPSLSNRIPLNYLASYIGITKSSLSRIRKELALG
ncbi:MAG: Crp/Fnr family transcriptional regulator [Cyclobacteriaceae bacterium]|nr:Crp/Fnr family transcriptional regulator [Cyclobacteriaceae bacterium HetDA_MAG_MS6]